ncbi:MAG: putative manganese transporter [Patescibacteria group bacterium]
MLKVFLDALIDSAKMIPLLFVIYVAIELIEYKFGNKIREKMQSAGKSGPAIGSIVGSFPQCGFSVIATALYNQRLVTIGTLLAVYLSTSDEAIPVILSQPEKAKMILPLILIKIVIALIAGYFVDFIFKKNKNNVLTHIENYKHGTDDKTHHHESVIEEKSCCGHMPNSVSKKFNPKEIFFHPLIHTLKIFLFIFCASLLIGIFIFLIGEETFYKFFSNQKFLQPFLAAIIGLIPNCASSVLIAQLYLKDVITFGSMIAGLCAGGGLGILILFKEEKNKRNAFKVLALLLGISIFVGLTIQYVL